MLHLVLKRGFIRRREQSDWGSGFFFPKKHMNKSPPKPPHWRATHQDHYLNTHLHFSRNQSKKENRSQFLLCSWNCLNIQRHHKTFLTGRICTLTPTKEGRKLDKPLEGCQWKSSLPAVLKGTCTRKCHWGHHQMAALKHIKLCI